VACNATLKLAENSSVMMKTGSNEIHYRIRLRSSNNVVNLV